MNMRNMKVKEQIFVIAVLHFSHSRVFNNQHNAYPEMSVNRLLACSLPVLITSVNKCSWRYFYLFLFTSDVYFHQ